MKRNFYIWIDFDSRVQILQLIPSLFPSWLFPMCNRVIREYWNGYFLGECEINGNPIDEGIIRDIDCPNKHSMLLNTFALFCIQDNTYTFMVCILYRLKYAGQINNLKILKAEQKIHNIMI